MNTSEGQHAVCPEKNGYGLDPKGQSRVPNDVAERDAGWRQHGQKPGTSISCL